MIRLRDFEPLEQVGESSRVSFRARSRATGAPLLIHLFRGASSPEGAHVLSLLPALPLVERSRILDFGQEQGAFFFLTQDLPGDLSFTDWIESASSSVRSLPMSPPRAVQESPTQAPRSMRPPPVPAPVVEPQTISDPDSYTYFERKNQRAAQPEVTSTTTEELDRWLREKSAGELSTRSGRSPLPDNPPPLAGSPMEWVKKPVPEVSSRNVFSPVFANDSARPMSRPEPIPKRCSQDRQPDSRFSGHPVPPSVNPLLKPLLLTLGIILAIALAVVLIMRIF